MILVGTALGHWEENGEQDQMFPVFTKPTV